MSAKHAVLGWLAHRPAYPYELADRLQERLGPTWAINSGQLSQLIRARYLIDAIGYNRVRGKPFRIVEIIEEAERLLAESDS